jgi:gas vesicle protein
MNSGKILLGVLAGVAVGAGLGILFAPDKGSSTRKKISKKGRDYAEGLEEKFNEFVDSITKKFETAKEKVIEKAGNGKTKSEDTLAEVTAALK